MTGRTRRVEEALARGADHHRAGRWRDAAAAYVDALRADPENVDAYTLLGGALLRMERPADAVAALDRAVSLDPTHALAQLNRGRALLAVERAADAVPAFEAALAARPGFREAALGRARALLSAGRPEEAVAALEGVTDTVSGVALLGAALLDAGRPGEAEAALRRALAVSPEDPRLHADLGAALLAQDRLVDAAAAWDAAARLAPALPGLAARRRSLARAIGLRRLSGGHADAADWLRRALGPASVEGAAERAGAGGGAERGGDPGVGGGAAGSGGARDGHSRGGDAGVGGGAGSGAARDGHSRGGDAGVGGGAGSGAARDGHSRGGGAGVGGGAAGSGGVRGGGMAAAAPAEAGDDHATLAALADALFQHPGRAERADLERLLAVDGIDHQRLARAAERVLAGEIDASHLGPSAVVPPPFLTPLLRAWLARAVVIAPGWLPALRAVRRRAMVWAIGDAGAPVTYVGESAHPGRTSASAAEALATLQALAIQAWNTEYADTGIPEEVLADQLAALPPTPARLAAFAIARPLGAWPGIDALALDAPGWEAHPLAALVRVQLVEPAVERTLATSLPALPATADATSAAVRAQYEENPYPRLVGVHRRAPSPFAEWLAAVLPGVPLPSPGELPARVLVAGGGTGQHPLGVAAALVDAEVVAVDLSRASLARGARLAQEHGLDNVRFVQGDLLALGPDDGLGRFGVVDCVGVLHHLADPLAGGRALVDKLAPGGLLRLGLYSERGRADVVAARRLVAEHGWEPTPAGLRAARAALLALPGDHPAAGLAASVDLYSQSGLRDLVFHPCEHRYTPLGVDALVRALGLRVVALQHARPEPARLYAARWPDDAARADLARWESLEAEHPRLFAGMIHVWCRVE